MNFSASAATKDAARLRRRRFSRATALLLDSTPQVARRLVPRERFA